LRLDHRVLSTTLGVLFSPAEFSALPRQDLSETTCVVFDVLRATSSMITALDHGAESIIPVGEISEALEIRKRDPTFLLAGERNGLRIRGDLTGGIDFDLGNSPREFTAKRVTDRTIVMTTTNGTRALRACSGAARVHVGSFLNLSALARDILARPPQRLLIVCSGTHDEASYEDTLAAGALSDLLGDAYAAGQVSDSVPMARQIYAAAEHDLLSAMQFARNGRRLLETADLADDVAFCLRRDATGIRAEFRQGRVARV